VGAALQRLVRGRVICHPCHLPALQATTMALILTMMIVVVIVDL